MCSVVLISLQVIAYFGLLSPIPGLPQAQVPHSRPGGVFAICGSHCLVCREQGRRPERQELPGKAVGISGGPPASLPSFREGFEVDSPETFPLGPFT